MFSADKLFTEVNSEEGFDIKFTGTHKEANDYINGTIGTLVQLSTRDVFTPTERSDIAASLRQVAGFFEKTKDQLTALPEQPKVTVTFRSKAEAIRMFNAAETAMDHFDNGTETMNSLRHLVNLLETAINKK
jgi:hypothetical protein